MNRVILVNPGVRNRNNFPLGLGLIGSVLMRDGYEVELINGNTDPDWSRTVLVSLSNRPALYVGYTAMSNQIGAAIKSAKLVKAGFPKIPVVFGGVHPTLVPNSVIRHGADLSVVGEADRVVVPLAEHCRGRIPLEDVPNLVHRNGRTKTAPLSRFEELPDLHPDLYERDMEKLVLKVRVGRKIIRGFSILTGLGCNFRCAFCINYVIKRRHRLRCAQSIFREIEYLHDFHGIEFFNFQDEHFTADDDRLNELLTILESAPFRIRWNACARINDILRLKDETLQRMKDSGMTDLGIGAESGSNRVLREVLHKGITREHTLEACRKCNRLRIPINMSFVMYWPGERFWERLQTLWIILRIQAMGPYCSTPFMQTYRPYPGSKWESDLSKFSDPLNLPDSMLSFMRPTPMSVIAKGICLAGMIKNRLYQLL